VTDRLIKITTAAAVITVAAVAAVISYQHAYELVRSHGESGLTARLLPFTVDGLIRAASTVVLDPSRRDQPVPRLAAWSLGTGIVATVGANLAHGVGLGPVGALVSAWARPGARRLIRTAHDADSCRTWVATQVPLNPNRVTHAGTADPAHACRRAHQQRREPEMTTRTRESLSTKLAA
jgi:hypothetical protein